MPTRQADKSEMRDVVREAIGTLNERQRLAVLLSKFENMSYEDIARNHADDTASHQVVVIACAGEFASGFRAISGTGRIECEEG